MEKVNPKSYIKRSFHYSDWTLEDINGYLDGIEKGVRHLHLLGLVYNDINLANIIFEKDGTPVIIDFGSCRAIR